MNEAKNNSPLLAPPANQQSIISVEKPPIHSPFEAGQDSHIKIAPIILAVIVVMLIFKALQATPSYQWLPRLVMLIILMAGVGLWLWRGAKIIDNWRNASIIRNNSEKNKATAKKIHPRGGFFRRNGYRLMILLIIIIGLRSVILVHIRDRINLDQGETSYNAARSLAHNGFIAGNPYDRNALIDHTAFWQFIGERDTQAQNIAAEKYQSLNKKLGQYMASFDSLLYQELLPQPPPPAAAHPLSPSWAHPLGYKYGPTILWTHYLTVPFFGRPVVMALNTLAYILFVVAMGRIIMDVIPHRVLALSILWLVAAEFNTRAMLGNSATDIYAIGFIALAIWAWMTGRGWLLGLSVALAITSKIMPSIMIVPLLALPHAHFGIKQIFIALVAAFLAILVVCLPFLVADAWGFAANYLMWPLLMGKNGTAWGNFVAPIWHDSARLAVVVILAVVWGIFYFRQWVSLLSNRQDFAPNANNLQKLTAHSDVTIIVIGIYFFSTTLVMITGNILHSNYFTWIAGFAIIYVAAIGYRAQMRQMRQMKNMPI